MTLLFQGILIGTPAPDLVQRGGCRIGRVPTETHLTGIYDKTPLLLLGV